MRRVGFILKVKKEKIEQYKAAHQAVWPEMKKALKKTGWHNYSLFIREDGLLFGYFETPENFETALAGMEEQPINERWQAAMSEYFESLGGKRADESMIELEEVFHLD